MTHESGNRPRAIARDPAEHPVARALDALPIPASFVAVVMGVSNEELAQFAASPADVPAPALVILERLLMIAGKEDPLCVVVRSQLEPLVAGAVIGAIVGEDGDDPGAFVALPDAERRARYASYIDACCAAAAQRKGLTALAYDAFFKSLAPGWEAPPEEGERGE
jgi:hypothetical protein